MVSTVLAQPAPCQGQRFVAEVYSELPSETIQKRWSHVNVLLRLSMLAGLPMQFEATLTLLCEQAAEIVNYEKALVFWDEGHDQMQLRTWKGFAKRPEFTGAGVPTDGNMLNLWAAKYERPLIVKRGQHASVDAMLDVAKAGAVLTLPLFAGNRVRGTLHLLAASPQAFAHEDAQLMWLFSLVSENLLTRESSSESLVRFAFTDYLTGLRSRGYFEQQLDLEFKRAERRREKFALLMIDIDHFKHLNDTLGHRAGDQVLREVASILVKDMREVDTVARYGGEEFVIILPETTELGARYVADRVRLAIERAEFLSGSSIPPRKLTISIGVAVYDRDARFKRELIEASDAALYTAKHQGRNRVACFSEMASPEKKDAS